MCRSFIAALMLVALVFAPAAGARTWTDATGSFTVNADLIAYNDELVVLQRQQDGELGAVAIEQLSQADREYLKSTDAEEHADRITGGIQTWTLRDGTKIRGRVVGYARKDITIQRRRGKIYVNDRVFENLPEIYQLMLPKIVAHFEKINQPDVEGLEAWMVRQKGQPRTFTIEGVVLELENGDEYVIPFFFFSERDLQVLKAGWREWLLAQQEERYDTQADQAFLLQSLAAALQRDQEIDRRIAMMQLNLQAQQAMLQAVQTGATSLWEVTLYPARGTTGPPLWVVTHGRDSREATNRALSQNPGYIAGPVRRVSRL